MPEHRITGQYRNTTSQIWDPHPQYLIDAFGLHLHLILYQDNNFMSRHIKVSGVQIEIFDKIYNQTAVITVRTSSSSQSFTLKQILFLFHSDYTCLA